MALWIFCAIIVLIGYVIFHFIRKALERATALKQPDLQTPLTEFKETNGIRQQLTKVMVPVIQNISERFEEMCVRHPLQYQNDPALPGVISEYRNLLRGKILDAEGRHVPSVEIDGSRNPDYETYLKGQRRALARVQIAKAGINGELKRLNRLDKEDDVKADFVVKLLNMNLPLSVLNGAMSEKKLSTYSEADWKEFGKCMRAYLSDYPEEIVSEFAETFDDQTILFDSDKMEIFAIFLKHEVPMRVVKEIVLGRITVGQAQRIMVLVQSEEEYTWDEAIQEVLEEDLKAATEKDLRDKYRAALKA